MVADAAAVRAMIIALDGPAAAGKGTLARALAAAYDLAYLDSGSLYRAVGLTVLQAGGNPSDPQAAEAAAPSLDLAKIRSEDMRSEAAGEAASKVASIPGVRAALLDYQRRFAGSPPGGKR